MDKYEEVKKHIGEEFKVNPNELGHFKDGKVTLTYKEKSDITWYIDVKLLDGKTMVITDIRRESIIKVC